MHPTKPPSPPPSFRDLDPRALASGRSRFERRAASARRSGPSTPLTADALYRHGMRLEAHRKLVGETQSAPVTPVTAKPQPARPAAGMATARSALMTLQPAADRGLVRAGAPMSRWSDSSASIVSHASTEAPWPADGAKNASDAARLRYRDVPMIEVSRWSDSSAEPADAAPLSDPSNFHPVREAAQSLGASTVFVDFAGYFDLVGSEHASTPRAPLTPQTVVSPHSPNSPRTPRTPMAGEHRDLPKGR